MTRRDTSSCTSPKSPRPRCTFIAVLDLLRTAPARPFDVLDHNALRTSANSDPIRPTKLNNKTALAYFGSRLMVFKPNRLVEPLGRPAFFIVRFFLDRFAFLAVAFFFVFMPCVVL